MSASVAQRQPLQINAAQPTSSPLLSVAQCRTVSGTTPATEPHRTRTHCNLCPLWTNVNDDPTPAPIAILPSVVGRDQPSSFTVKRVAAAGYEDDSTTINQPGTERQAAPAAALLQHRPTLGMLWPTP
jgi:hypothetical protein